MPSNRRVGIITAGGDSPGLNAAIRGFGKAAIGYGMEVVGFRDGFRGLAEDRRVKLDTRALAGILTVGGTILGTSRDKPHRMLVDGEVRDMTAAIVETAARAEPRRRSSASAAAARPRTPCASRRPGSTS